MPKRVYSAGQKTSNPPLDLPFYDESRVEAEGPSSPGSPRPLFSYHGSEISIFAAMPWFAVMKPATLAVCCNSPTTNHIEILLVAVEVLGKVTSYA